jgi:S-adenosylmethionine synthetase
MSYIFTSESVTSGHPDKICDQISDAILDECLRQDPNSKVAIDCWVKGNNLGLIGELTTNAKVDFESIARTKIKEIGYFRSEYGFDYSTVQIQNLISEQSVEINHAVVLDNQIGAGDQGIMFGYACRQTQSMMPLPIDLAHKLALRLERVRKGYESKGIFVLGPDGKTQVSIEFDSQNNPVAIDNILISTQHSPEYFGSKLERLVINEVILPVLESSGLSSMTTKTKFLINPSGSFVIGGPVADSGLTGRKIIVDSYGGWSRVGGGAFSGKDPSKVDRSGAYMARFLAKQIINQGMAEDCEIQLSYAIGKAEPVSIAVFGNLKKTSLEITNWIINNYDLTPKGIIDFLQLTTPIYSHTSCYGHFGKSGLKWEEV